MIHADRRIRLAVIFSQAEFTRCRDLGSFLEILRKAFAALAPYRSVEPDRAFVLSVPVIDGDREAENSITILGATENGIFANSACDVDDFHIHAAFCSSGRVLP